MTQSIQTKYIHATTRCGGQYEAKTSGGVRRTYSAFMCNHFTAAKSLARELGWLGRWQGGALDNSGAMVWINTSDAFSKDYQFTN